MPSSRLRKKTSQPLDQSDLAKVKNKNKSTIPQSETIYLHRLFHIDFNKRQLYLKYLPDQPGKKALHTMIIVLFGYREIFAMDNISKPLINLSLLKSKLRKPSGLEWLSAEINPIDFYESDEIYFDGADKPGYETSQLIEKTSLSSGGTFKLTGRGYEQAQRIVADLIDRA
jgi:hypothetical protein